MPYLSSPCLFDLYIVKEKAYPAQAAYPRCAIHGLPDMQMPAASD